MIIERHSRIADRGKPSEEIRRFVFSPSQRPIVTINTHSEAEDLPLPPSDRLDLRPNRADLIERYGDIKSVPAGTIEFSGDREVPYRVHIGNGWVRSYNASPYLSSPPPVVRKTKKPSHLKEPATLVLDRGSRMADLARFMARVRRASGGSFRGVSKKASTALSVVLKVESPKDVGTVRLKQFLAVLKCYGLDLRVTNAPFADADMYAGRDSGMEFERFIRDRRTGLGLTQAELAQKAGVTRNQVAYLENRKGFEPHSPEDQTRKRYLRDLAGANTVLGPFLQIIHALDLIPVIDNPSLRASFSEAHDMPHRNRASGFRYADFEEREERLLDNEERYLRRLYVALEIVLCIERGERVMTGFESSLFVEQEMDRRARVDGLIPDKPLYEPPPPVEGPRVAYYRHRRREPTPAQRGFTRLGEMNGDMDDDEIAPIDRDVQIDISDEAIAAMDDFAKTIRDLQTEEAQRIVAIARYRYQMINKPFDPEQIMRDIKARGFPIERAHLLVDAEDR